MSDSPRHLPVEPPSADAFPEPKPRSFKFAAVLPAKPEAISPLRRELEGVLHVSGLAHIADDFALSAQELMANAVVHGCRHCPEGPITVTVSCDGQRIRLSVEDPSEARPHLSNAFDGATSGRGMLIVDAFADGWGVKSLSKGAGKAVWMEMACTPSYRRVAA
ncbi:ATP-binding protein [Streptomyces sp. NBC_00987]|uniref:ATP-binding protein n=1 Tax=Streptomyces sp. NBC_00987 TaxID=2903703 RepID=UPI00386CBE7D|nr:ATP-binding protein [Streptomyces sp. NBC_00987]